jgi:hypothetical protein
MSIEVSCLHWEALVFREKGNTRESAYDAWGSALVSDPEQVTERPGEPSSGPSPDDAQLIGAASQAGLDR